MFNNDYIEKHLGQIDEYQNQYNNGGISLDQLELWQGDSYSRLGSHLNITDIDQEITPGLAEMIYDESERQLNF